MNFLRVILALTLLALAGPTMHAAVKSAPASPDELAKCLEQALKTKNKNAALELFYWEGASADMKAKQQISIDMLFDEIGQGLELTSVKPAELPPGLQSEQVIGGVKYVPNIPVLGAIHVMLAEDTNPTEFVFAYGKKDKSFFLAALVAEKDTGKPSGKE